MIQQALNQALSTGLAGAYLYSQTPHYKTRAELNAAKNVTRLENMLGEEIDAESPLAEQIAQAQSTEAELNLKLHPSKKTAEQYQQARYGIDEWNRATQELAQKKAVSEQIALERYTEKANQLAAQRDALKERLDLLHKSVQEEQTRMKGVRTNG